MKILSIAILVLFNLTAYSSTWKTLEFLPIPEEVQQCINKQKNPLYNPDAKKFPPLISVDCKNSMDEWSWSYYLVNKENQFAYLKHPIENVRQNLDKDDSSSLPDDFLRGPHLIFQNGDTYGQLCFHEDLGGKEECFINMFIDFKLKRITDPEIGNYAAPLILDSKRGILARTDQDPDISKERIIIQKIFSKTNKSIDIQTKNYLVLEGKFLSESKLQVILKNDKTHKKIKKTFNFNPKELED